MRCGRPVGSESRYRQLCVARCRHLQGHDWPPACGSSRRLVETTTTHMAASRFALTETRMHCDISGLTNPVRASNQGQHEWTRGARGRGARAVWPAPPGPKLPLSRLCIASHLVVMRRRSWCFLPRRVWCWVLSARTNRPLPCSSLASHLPPTIASPN